MKRIATAGLVTLLALAGCAAPGQPPGSNGTMNATTGGTLLGAGTGALIGNQFGHGSGQVGATILGGLLGAFAGNSIGRGIDERDQAYANQASQQAFENGQSGAPTQWRNPDNGNYGTVVPQAAYQRDGRYCREFQQTIVVNGQSQNAYGTACRQPDGTWKVVS